MFTKIRLIGQWWSTWKSFPVFSWIDAAHAYRQGNFQKASNLYEKGLGRHSSHPAGLCARMDLAYCYFRQTKFDLAEKELRHVMNHQPQLKEAYLRLARLQMWSGRPLEACWTLRKGLKELGPEAEIVATFLLAVIDNGGPGYLIQEAVSAFEKLPADQRTNQKLEVAVARLALFRGDKKKGREALSRLASGLEAPFEAVIAYAEILLDEGRIAHGRQQLRRAMLVAPNHPKVLFLFAKSYIEQGPFYNADYAKQLALSACQNSGWYGAKEMHLLAHAYSEAGDKLSALIIAHKAKEAGTKLLGNYHETKKLDELIETLSSAQ